MPSSTVLVSDWSQPLLSLPLKQDKEKGKRKKGSLTLSRIKPSKQITRNSEQIAINIKAEIRKRSIARVRKNTSITSGIHRALDLSPIRLRNREVDPCASSAGIYHSN